MHISATDPIAPAWNHMVRILFKPFELKKWLLLGFCAFLVQCGQSAGSATGNWSRGSYNSPREMLESAETWTNTNMSLFIGLAIGIGLAVLIMMIIVAWLSSRGQFMLLDGIIKNRGAVVEPWTEYRAEGNSLCLFRVVVSICCLIAFTLAVGIPFYMAIPDIRSEIWGDAATNALIVFLVTFFPLILFTILFEFFTNTFLAPTMYKKRVSAMEGISIAWHQLCEKQVAPALLLLLMLIVFGIGTALIAVIATCATCCIAGLPYISSVVLLPITVFTTCYVLEYIQQFGPEWTFFRSMCASCGYDREGLDAYLACPECGQEPTPDE